LLKIKGSPCSRSDIFCNHCRFNQNRSRTTTGIYER
jgi:hypothetical protein